MGRIKKKIRESKMEWLQFLILIITIGGLFLWNRSEANNDRREFNKETKELRRELIEVVRSIDTEMKDFHGRLCAIEERRKNK